MRLLLDTHVFLWWLLKDARLSEQVKALILDLSNQLFLSSASGFEIATKVVVRKLKLPADLTTFVEAGMNQNRITSLPVTFRHTYRLATLPLLHRDPFDRLLVATALEEGLELVTDDPEIKKYPVPIIW